MLRQLVATAVGIFQTFERDTPIAEIPRREFENFPAPHPVPERQQSHRVKLWIVRLHVMHQAEEFVLREASHRGFVAHSSPLDLPCS